MKTCCLSDCLYRESLKFSAQIFDMLKLIALQHEFKLIIKYIHQKRVYLLLARRLRSRSQLLRQPQISNLAHKKKLYKVYVNKDYFDCWVPRPTPLQINHFFTIIDLRAMQSHDSIDICRYESHLPREFIHLYLVILHLVSIGYIYLYI